MEDVARRRAAAALAGLFLATGGAFAVSMSAASAQTVPSTTTTDATTTIIATTAPQTTAPPVDSTEPPVVEGEAVGPLCSVVTPQPAVGDPVVTQVILGSTGEVVATRTGSGPFVPADFNTRCTEAAAPVPATPAPAVPGQSAYTG